MDKKTRVAGKKTCDDVEGVLTTAQTDIQVLADNVRNEFDDLSEKQQESDKGQELEALADALSEAADAIQDALDRVASIEWGDE